MIQKLLEAAHTDIEVRSIINVAFRAGEITAEQAKELSHNYAVEFVG